MFKKIVGLGFKTKWKDKKEVASYIKELVDGGATEFFTWYNPPYWHEKYGFEVSTNGRFSEHEQITDFDTLREISEEIHKYKTESWDVMELFLNLNAWYYSELTFPLIKQLLDETKDLIDGVIVGNIWMLEYLREINFNKKINISTILAVYNSEAIRFLLENYKINKVILSREVTIKEISEIAHNFPDIKFEVFGEGDFCRYNNWLCFAEHKYWSRDICTVILDDFEVKKTINPAYKKIILSDLIESEKLEKMDNKYIDSFDEISNIVDELELLENIDVNKLEKRLIELIDKLSTSPNLYYDWLQNLNSKRNQKIIKFLKWLKYGNANLWLNNVTLQKEIEKNIKSWMEFYFQKVKELFGESNIQAQYLNWIYNRNDNLNIFAYLYFSEIKNIETVKFPTRWRNNVEKLKLIEEIINSWKKEEVYKLIDRWSSIDRASYDLTYIFGDKLWFRKMIK